MPETAMAGPSPAQTSAGRLAGVEDANGGMATQQEIEAVKARTTPIYMHESNKFVSELSTQNMRPAF